MREEVYYAQLRRSCAAFELVNYTPKPRVVYDDAAFGVLDIQKQKSEEEFAQLDFLSALRIAA